eukprot:3627449-Amphidinium_carterae.1
MNALVRLSMLHLEESGTKLEPIKPSQSVKRVSDARLNRKISVTFFFGVLIGTRNEGKWSCPLMTTQHLFVSNYMAFYQHPECRGTAACLDTGT